MILQRPVRGVVAASSIYNASDVELDGEAFAQLDLAVGAVVMVHLKPGRGHRDSAHAGEVIAARLVRVPGVQIAPGRVAWVRPRNPQPRTAQ